MRGSCGLNAENIVYSLGCAGLSAEGMAEACKQGSTTFDALACGGYASTFLSELCWAAANAASMPEDCSLRELEGADCTADSITLVANTANLASDGFAVETDCFQGINDPIEAGRRLSGGPAFVATKGNETVRGGALYAMGLLGSNRRGHARQGGGALKGSSMSAGTYASGAANSSNATPTRAVDVATCYFTAENTASTVVDAVFSVWIAAKACRHFQRHGDLESQQGCAAAISDFLSDLATVVSYGALLASVCPVVPPAATAPCTADWADGVSVLANYAAWGSSFGASCLGVGEEKG